MVFGSSPFNLYSGRDGDTGLLFGQDTSISAQCAQHRRLRIANFGASWRQTSSDCADVKAGGSAISDKTAIRKSALCWRGPAAILDIDDTGFTVRSPCQTVKSARFCERRQGEPEDTGEVDWNPPSGSMDALEGFPSSRLGRRDGEELFSLAERRVLVRRSRKRIEVSARSPRLRRQLEFQCPRLPLSRFSCHPLHLRWPNRLRRLLKRSNCATLEAPGPQRPVVRARRYP